MKTFIIAFIFLSQTTWAAGLNMNPQGPSETEVRAKTSELRASLKAIHPTNEVAISACEEKTGAIFSEIPANELPATSFVYCIVITTQTYNSRNVIDVLLSRAEAGNIIIHSNHVDLY